MQVSSIFLLLQLWMSVKVSSSQTAITCTVPNIRNGFVTGDVDDYNENKYLPFRCNPLYKSVDERPSKCVKSGLRANWSPTPACERIVCKPPASLEGTQYEPESINVFSPGETMRVICGHKYWIDNHRVNSAVVTCKDTGEWDLRPVCQEVTCSNQRPQHVYNWYVPQRGKITLDETAGYTCVRGYKKPDGFNLATCTREGWKPNPLCQALCSKPDVPNGIAAGPYNHTVFYTCKEGYKLFTKGWWATATCDKASGSEKWSGWEKCIENTACGELPTILNGRANKPNEQSSVAQITCNPGYRPKLKQLICRAGEWRSNGYSPQTICTPTAKPCDPPRKVNNAVVEGPYQKEYLSNSRVTYRCRKNYMMEGEPGMICKNGQWKENIFSCKPYCEKPKNESMTITADKETYKDGETLKYTCDTSGVEGIATCLNTKWNETEICEVPLDCGRSPFITNGDTKETSRSHHRHNERVEYACQAYHTMEGEPYKTCINGSWIGEMKCLKPCTADKEAMNSRNIRFRFISDDKLYSVHHQWLEFACIYGTSNDGTIGMRQRCEDGVIQLPTCQ